MNHQQLLKCIVRVFPNWYVGMYISWVRPFSPSIILTDVRRSWLTSIPIICKAGGLCLLRKHKAAFLPSYPTPINSLVKEGQSILVHHITWLYFLRERIWSRIKYEEEMIPSDGALQRYWQRSCWVSRKNGSLPSKILATTLPKISLLAAVTAAMM